MRPVPFYAARTWTALHSGDDRAPCCYGSMYNPENCTCWEPVYDRPQLAPVPVTRPELILFQPAMCGDCAYRKTSPERADPYTEEQLLTWPLAGDPFWCHQGMRRPVRWEHPDGRDVPGDNDDWHPARVGNFLYQADGSPALLCAGWIRRRQRHAPGAPMPVAPPAV